MLGCCAYPDYASSASSQDRAKGQADETLSTWQAGIVRVDIGAGLTDLTVPPSYLHLPHSIFALARNTSASHQKNILLHPVNVSAACTYSTYTFRVSASGNTCLLASRHPGKGDAVALRKLYVVV
jgi:hypothetical protein